MRKTWALGICAAAVIAAAAGGAGVASAATGTSPHGKNQTTFTVYSHMIEAHVIAPCSTCATPALPAGSKVGAEYVNDPVFDEKTGGQQIGQEALVITIVSSDASTALLSGAVSLTEGALSGELAVTGEIDARASSGVVAVTGGTGSFRGAKGEIAYSGAGLTSTVTTLTAHLTL
jgi:Dirigent-like protein